MSPINRLAVCLSLGVQSTLSPKSRHRNPIREPIIEVDDKNHKPIAGAAMLFSLNLPSLIFGNGAQVLSMMTNTAGQVAIHGMRPNDANNRNLCFVLVCLHPGNLLMLIPAE